MLTDSGRPQAEVRDVFVSYASIDHQTVQPVVEALVRAGITCWFDRWDLEPFDSNITDRISRAIENSRLTLVFLSDEYTARTACRWELLKTLQCSSLDEGLSSLFIIDLARRESIPWDFLNENLRLTAPPVGADPSALDSVAAAVDTRLVGCDLRSPRPGFAADWWPSRNPADSLVGRFGARLELFDKLSRHLGKDASGGRTLPPVQLVGLGGMGKSMLALRFAADFEGMFPGGVVRLDGGADAIGGYAKDDEWVIRHVLGQVRDWINETVEDRQFDPALSSAAPSPDSEVSWRKIVRAARQVLAQLPGAVLWIIDDLPEGLSAEAFGLLCCPDPVNGRTLITTRTDYYQLPLSTVRVDELGLAESIQLLRSSTQYRLGDDDQTALEGLATAVGFHALALAMLAPRLATSTPTQVLAEITNLEQTGAILEAEARLGRTLPTGHAPSIVATLALSINSLAERPQFEAALTVLRIAAMLPAGYSIPGDLLIQVFSEDATAMRAALAGLTEANLAQIDRSGETMSVRVHALVSAVALVGPVRESHRDLWATPADSVIRPAAARWLRHHAKTQDVWAAADTFTTAWGLFEPITDELNAADRIVAADSLLGLVRTPMRHVPQGMNQDELVAHIDQLGALATRSQMLVQGDDRETELARGRALAMRGLLLAQKCKELSDADEQMSAASESHGLLIESLETRRRWLDRNIASEALELARAEFNLGRHGLQFAQVAATASPADVQIWLDRAEGAYTEAREPRTKFLPQVPPGSSMDSQTREDYEALASCWRGLGLVAYIRALCQPDVSEFERLEFLLEAENFVSEAHLLTTRARLDGKDSADMVKDFEVQAKILLARMALHSATGGHGPGDRKTIDDYVNHDRQKLLTALASMGRALE